MELRLPDYWKVSGLGTIHTHVACWTLQAECQRKVQLTEGNSSAKAVRFVSQGS